MLARYCGPDPKSAEFEKFDRDCSSIRAGVLKLLQVWVNNPLVANDFARTAGFPEALLSFCSEWGINSKELNVLQRSSSRLGKSGSVVNLDSGTRSRRKEKVFELPVQNVAQQLTLIEYTLLNDIRLTELYGQAWNKEGKDERAPNVLKYISWFNRVSRWVCTEIITLSGEVERAAAITKFIEIGKELFLLNNFNGVIEILSALHSSSIARLKDSWALVQKPTLVSLEELDLLMSSDGNFRYYRSLLERTPPPVVPYLGLLLTDLTFLDDANLTQLKGGKDGSKLLNLQKIRMMANVLKLFKKCLSVNYIIREMRSIRALLFEMEGFDDNELYRISKLREAPGSAAGAKKLGGNKKLISQMTSAMLIPRKLEVSQDSFSKDDWDAMLGSEGTYLEVKKKGDVIVVEGKPVQHLYRVKSGTVLMTSSVCGDGSILQKVQEDGLFGQLSILNPSMPSNQTAVVSSEMCEVWVIPRIVVHAVCQDVEQSRRFFGSMAQDQVKFLSTFNIPARKQTISRETVPEGSQKWDILWNAKNSNQRDFNFLGILVLTNEDVTLSSNMLGFLTRELLCLSDIQSVCIKDNLGQITTAAEKNNVKTFKCANGVAETGNYKEKKERMI